MTFGAKLRNFLAAAKAGAAPGTWTADAWVKAVDEFVEVERPLGKDGKAKAPKRQLPINKMTEEQFMTYLQSSPALAGIDIQREIGRCNFHFQAKGITVSRMRLINWLNRADKNLASHGRDANARQATVNERSAGAPHGWAEWAKNRQREWAAVNGGEENGVAAYAIRTNSFFTLPLSWRCECRKAIGDGTT